MGTSPGVEVAVLVYRHLMKDLEMLKTPPTLKWLAEKRARVAGKLEPQELLLQKVELRVVKLRADLKALDQALGMYDSSVNASAIKPIAAQAGNYGTRGSLTACLASVVEANSPGSVSTRELLTQTVVRFGLVFETSELRLRWTRNSLRNALKALAKAGKLEAVPGTKAPQMSYWRWVQPKQFTLAELRASAALLDAEVESQTAGANA